MSFAGHAFVDWDDTIAENIRHFHEVERANAALIGRVTGVSATEVLKRGEELDVAVARRLGLVKESMGIAWAECYREFCDRAGKTPDPALESVLRQACLRPFEIKQELLPGAPETLGWLHRAGFEITIWTAGEIPVQSRKIDESGLGHLIHRRAIVLEKTPERLRDALDGRSPDRSFVVGNSIHSDILPALKVGIPAFHIPVETWAYDRGHLDVDDPNYYRLEQFADLPRMLTTRFRLAV